MISKSIKDAIAAMNVYNVSILFAMCVDNNMAREPQALEQYGVTILVGAKLTARGPAPHV